MGAYTYKTSDLLVTSIEKNEIKQNSPETLPLNPTGQGFSGQEVRRRLSHSIVGEEGSLLSLFTMRMQIAKDILDNVFEQVENLKNDLELEAERLDGEVIRVEQKADAHIEDVDNPHGVTAEQVDTYVKTTIDNKDTNTLDSAKSYADSLVPDLSGIEQDITNLESDKLDKIWNDITSQSLTNLNDEFVLNRGGIVYKTTLANMLSNVVPTYIFTVVAELPEAGLPNKIYLVPSSEPETQNALDEFIWVDNDWEKIGAVSVDLNDYYDKEEVNDLLKNALGNVLRMEKPVLENELEVILQNSGTTYTDFDMTKESLENGTLWIDNIKVIDKGVAESNYTWEEKQGYYELNGNGYNIIFSFENNEYGSKGGIFDLNDKGGTLKFLVNIRTYVDYRVDNLDLGDKNVQSNWNETDDTEDSYIQNKPTIPNVSNFITKDVADLTNYYDKTTSDSRYIQSHQSLANYYNKTEIDSMVGDIETVLDTILGV